MSQDGNGGARLPRSASPAKRRATEMEDTLMANSSDSSSETIDTDMKSQETARPDNQLSSELTAATSLQSTSPATSISEQNENKGLQGTQEKVPSLDEQVEEVMALMNAPLEEGARGVVISRKWLDRVQSRTTSGLSEVHFSKAAREGEIGRVDNSDIVDEGAFSEPILKDEHGASFIPLRLGLVSDRDIQIVPDKAWGLIVGWYGIERGQKAIIRYSHNTAEESGAVNIEYELYPPVLTIRKFVVNKPAEQERDTARTATLALKMKKTRESFGQMSPDDAIQLVSSRAERYQRFLTRAKEHTGILMTTKVKVLKVAPPPEPIRGRSRLLVGQSELDELSAESRLTEIAALDQTGNDKYNGSSTMLTYEVSTNQTLLLVEQPSKDTPAAKRAVYVSKTTKPDSRRSSPAPGAMTRGRALRNGRTRGTVGLTNLGNTCYMNSALQCIRSVEELAIYFLVGKYKSEINASNPLGHKGAMATKYADVVKGIYNENASSSFSPSAFKSTLSRCGPTFSGYGQQDSQEFLSFLVDALHEDLNRIEKKPYLENPDSDDSRVMDPQYIVELGEVFRKNHRARNDSIAMDLFSGFYKNTMECPTCDKVSVTFDPFSLLTLQLPVNNDFSHAFIFVPRFGPSKKYNMEVDRNFTVRDLKQYIAKQNPGLDASKLWLAEVYSHKLYKTFEDAVVLNEARIQANDHMFVFELEYTPTCPPSTKQIPRMESDEAEILTIPINHRLMKNPNSSSLPGILHTQYISLTREEAKDIDLIQKKVLVAVAQFTSRPILTEQYSTGTDTEEIEANVSDHSEPSDEDYVNVSMNTAPTSTSEHGIPDGFFDPSYKLSDRLSSMLFRLGWSKSADGVHCAGLNSYEANARPLLTRVRPPSRRASFASSTTEESTDTMLDDTESQDGAALTSATADSPMSIPEETNDESDAPVGPLRRNTGKGNKFKGGQNDNKLKAKHKRDAKAARKAKQRPVTPQSTNTTDDPYYIHLGETILVDWYSEAYDELFKGIPGNAEDKRGHWLSSDTGADLEATEDDAAAEKRARRDYRKTNGISLEDCFAETGKREKLSEDNAWYCNRCKELRQATKTLEIWTAPDILVLHLKRFGGNRRFNDKIDVQVNYPAEGLDLNGKIGHKEDGKDYTYDLFAVDNHYGGLGGGHYTAEAKNFFDDVWYDYNDSNCSRKSQPRPAASAYLLFYRRRSDKPLGPEYLQKLVMKFREPSEDTDETESGEEQLDAPSYLLQGSSSNSLVAGATAKTSHVQTAGAAGSLGQVGLPRKMNTNLTMNEDEGISMEDDDQPPAYGPIELPGGYSQASPEWSFAPLDAADDLSDTDVESTTAEVDRDETDEGFQGFQDRSAWNELETEMTFGGEHIESAPHDQID